MKHPHLKKILLSAILGLAMIFSSTSPTKAQELRGCSAGTYNAMANQAMLEVQRENMFNQTYIAKPDSIMMYTCMREQTIATGLTAGPIFSESDAWHNRTVDISGTTVNYTILMNVYMPSSLSNALEYVVGSSIQTYLASNYNHDILGGSPQ